MDMMNRRESHRSENKYEKYSEKDFDNSKMEKTESKKSLVSMSSKRGAGNKQDKIQIKSIQDRFDQMNSKLIEMEGKLYEISSELNKVIPEFNNMKSKQEHDAVRRNEFESKLRLVDKMTKNLEGDFDKTKNANDIIKKNLEQIDTYVSFIKREVTRMDNNAKNEHDSNSKTIVRLRIGIENINREFEYFRKEFKSKIEISNKVLKDNEKLKELFEKSYKDISNKMTENIVLLNNEIVRLKSSQDAIK